MSTITQHTRRLGYLVAREWLLLWRNPHGLIALFMMPAAFVLIMSFTLKNTLIADVVLPATGWVNEDSSPPAVQWSREWLTRPFVHSYSSRDALRQALRSNEIGAGVIARNGVLQPPGSARVDVIEMWLGNRVQPAAAARLRVELNYSIFQAQMKIAAAEAGPFASVLLSGASASDWLPQRDGLTVRYLYEIESGRKMTAVQQSVPAWLVFGMFFVVIPIAGVLIQERNDRTLARLITFGVSPGLMLAGKLVAFMLLNWFQLALMLVVGRLVVPLLGGDTLDLCVPLGWFVLIGVSSMPQRWAVDSMSFLPRLPASWYRAC
jgi:ABC-2 type transport system permease protein